MGALYSRGDDMRTLDILRRAGQAAGAATAHAAHTAIIKNERVCEEAGMAGARGCTSLETGAACLMRSASPEISRETPNRSLFACCRRATRRRPASCRSPAGCERRQRAGRARARTMASHVPGFQLPSLGRWWTCELMGWWGIAAVIGCTAAPGGTRRRRHGPRNGSCRRQGVRLERAMRVGADFTSVCRSAAEQIRLRSAC